MSTITWRALLLGLATAATAIAAEPGEERRERATKAFQQKNYKDAYADYRALALDPGEAPGRAGDSLKAAIKCLGALSRDDEVDELRDAAIAAHKDQWRLLLAAAQTFAEGPDAGNLVGGKFVRGWNSGQNGRFVSCVERDRVQGLRLLARALELARKESDRAGLAELHLAYARFLIMEDAWYGFEAARKARRLTNLDDLPDYEDGDDSDSLPVDEPADAGGQPAYFRRPETDEAARNDGERWRWHLERCTELDPARRSEARMALADFLRGQYDVLALALGVEPGRVVDGELTDELEPSELARVRQKLNVPRIAPGIKGLSPPDEFNHFKIYRSIAERDSGEWGKRALDVLGESLENRGDYDGAAEIWSQAIGRYGPGEDDSRKKRLAQIVGKWGEFGSAQVQTAGKPATVDFYFRNARSVRFEAHEIKVERLLDDAKAYLKSRRAGMKLDVAQIELSRIGPRTIAPGGQDYLGPCVASWDLALDPKAGHRDRSIVVETPLRKAGAYLLTARVADGGSSRIVVTIADTVIVRKPAHGGQFFFVADAITGRPVPDANLEFFGYHAEMRQQNDLLTSIETQAFTRTTGADGQLIVDAKALDPESNWLTIARTSTGRRASLGFEDRWHFFTSVSDRQRQKTYLITDRPIYRPGQHVKFKGWMRRSIDHGPADQATAHRSVRMKITNPRSETVFERDYTSDDVGGFDGEYMPAKDASLGTYTLALVGRDEGEVQDSVVFRVEEYRKPEFAVSIDTPSAPVRLGERFTATVAARYYFGTPVRQAKVRFQVRRTRVAQAVSIKRPWDWLYGPGYGSFGRHYAWPRGRLFWRTIASGRPTIGLTDREMGWFERHGAASGPDGAEQINWDGIQKEEGELITQGEGTIGTDGTLKISVDTARALVEYPGVDHRYVISAQVVDGSRRTIIGTGSVLVAARSFEAFSSLDRGFYRPGQEIVAHLESRAPDGKPVSARGKATLFRIRYEEEKPVEQAVERWSVSTDGAGSSELRLNASEPGQYRLAFTLDDGRKPPIERACVFLVAGDRFDGEGLQFDDLELIPDRRVCRAGDKVRLLVNASRPNATVLLFLRAAHGKVGPARLLRLNGKSTTFEVEIAPSDVPNLFIEGLTIGDGGIYHDVAEILVPPEKKTLHVDVNSSLASYPPGAPAKVAVKLTDEAGKPFVGAAALTIYDKGLEHLAEGTNVPEIRPFFWGWRSEHDVRHDSNVLITFAKLVDKGQDQMASIGVLGNQAIWNSMFQYSFAARSARTIAFDTVDNPAPQKAEPAEVQPHVRKSFADTALWAPALTTNAQGVAEVGLTMPENLTTWKIRAWAIGAGNEVGEGEAETITTKNLLVRLQVPRFLVQGDEAVLSAIIHHELATDQLIRAVLELDGNVLELRDEASRTVRIKSAGEQRVDWKVRVVAPGEAVVRVKALGHEESDATEVRVPAVVHGQLKTDSFAGSIGRDSGSARLTFRVPEARRGPDSRVEIRYSPTLAGALVDALPYLADYPYGCTEQTLNRFLPTVIAQGVLRRMGLDLKAIPEQRTNLNPQERAGPSPPIHSQRNPVFDEARVHAMAVEGLNALASMQLSDGAWGWFSGHGERPDAHLTALVVHGLQAARAGGLTLVPGMSERGTEWLRSHQAEQVRLLGNAAKKTKPFRPAADNLDALVFMVLSDAGVASAEMLEFLDRDRPQLSVYGLTLFGLALEKLGRKELMGQVVHTIEQYLVKDPENQTAYLRLPGDDDRWRWYTSDIETQACYLKLLARIDPKGATAPALVKYLLNNRRHATYWDSTRDTALCIEAMAEYLRASGEDRPDMVVAISVDGKPRKQVAIGPDNLFHFDNTLVLTGDEVGSGEHTVEITRQGQGPVYFHAYVTYFTLEDPIRRTGLEIKVDRKLYRIRSEGATPPRRRNREVREKLTDGSTLSSGDIVEVELVIDGKNDFEYLLLEDRKPAGFEPIALRSGYNGNDLGAYMELRDQTVCFFTRTLSRGVHSVRYRVRAEVPGRFSALPAVVHGMYAPDLKGNSDEAKIVIGD